MDKLKVYENLLRLNQGVFHGSWAIWKGDSREDVGDYGYLNQIPENKSLMKLLNPCVMMIALNPSGSESRRPNSRDKKYPWRNFHSAQNNDYRICKVFKSTTYYGAYMTDLIKLPLGPNCGAAERRYDDLPKETRRENAKLLEKEIMAIGVENLKKIIVFGDSAYKVLKKMLSSELKHVQLENVEIIKVWHYAKVCKEDTYIEQVNKSLGK